MNQKTCGTCISFTKFSEVRLQVKNSCILLKIFSLTPNLLLTLFHWELAYLTQPFMKYTINTKIIIGGLLTFHNSINKIFKGERKKHQYGWQILSPPLSSCVLICKYVYFYLSCHLAWYMSWHLCKFITWFFEFKITLGNSFFNILWRVKNIRFIVGVGVLSTILHESFS